MNLSAFEHCLFLPGHGDQGTGTFYELTPQPDFTKSSFVLLPYYNPKEEAMPKFFAIANKKEIQLPQSLANSQTFELSSLLSKEQYLETIRHLKQHIQRGDIYEINYCIKFAATEVELDPLNVFLNLHKLSKAPYSAFLKTGDDFILCASPELFLKKDNKVLSTKPIKGTTRRGKDPEEDKQLADALLNSLKERTENVMAVDVARNDLSRLAKKGSVTVNKLYNIESFETVHQMVSTVSCHLRENLSFKDITDATFPMASMTGAPKLRAMQLINQYENFQRGYYSGAMGLADERENFSLAVLIRSIFYNQKKKEVSICVGGAITYLSDPEKEYEECLLKAKALLTALNAVIK